MALAVHAQDETHQIYQREAKDLLKSLNQKSADTVRINYLLTFVLYNILKPGENKADLGSAVTFNVEQLKVDYLEST